MKHDKIQETKSMNVGKNSVNVLNKKIDIKPPDSNDQLFQLSQSHNNLNVILLHSM